MRAKTTSDSNPSHLSNQSGRAPRPEQPWYLRIVRQKLTVRTLFVYVGALLLLYLSDPWGPTFAIGCGVLLIAGALRIWTFGHLRKNLDMVTTGPYAHTRNPAYLGSLLALLGFGLAAGNPYTGAGKAVWALSVLFLLVFFYFYLPRKYQREYGRLKRLFPDQYAQHAANVPHLLPQLKAWRSGDTGRFSWRCVQDNNEWAWPVLVILAMAAIWFV